MWLTPMLAELLQAFPHSILLLWAAVEIYNLPAPGFYILSNANKIVLELE